MKRIAIDLAFLLACVLGTSGCRGTQRTTAPSIVRVSARLPHGDAQTVADTVGEVIATGVGGLGQHVSAISTGEICDVYVVSAPDADPQQFLVTVRQAVESCRRLLPADADGASVLLQPPGIPIPRPAIWQVQEIQVLLDRDKVKALGISPAEMDRAMAPAAEKSRPTNKDANALAATVLQVDGKSVRLGDVAEFKVVAVPSHVVRTYR